MRDTLAAKLLFTAFFLFAGVMCILGGLVAVGVFFMAVAAFPFIPERFRKRMR